MESKMTVVKKYDTIPLRGLPEEILNKKILEFSEWLTRLLSIKSTDENVDKLEVLLPIMKDRCWSMNISDMQKAFMMYVQNKLPIEARSNYLDTILFNQVVTYYKDQLPKPKPKELPMPELSDKEKENLIYTGCINAFDEWNQDREVLPGYTWVYDHLTDLKIYVPGKEEKKSAMKKAKAILNGAAIRNPDQAKRKQVLAELEKKSSPQIINKAKRLLLSDFFSRIKEHRKHIKDYL